MAITEERCEAELKALESGNEPGVSTIGKGIFGQVVAGLRGSGFSPIAIWSIVKLILELIEEYGPEVAKIIERIKEIFDKK
jgi:hypothetical protein